MTDTAEIAELAQATQATQALRDNPWGIVEVNSEEPAGQEAPWQVDQSPQQEPAPVWETDRVYNTYRDELGEDVSEALKREWGDNAVRNEKIMRAVIADHPRLDSIYVEHQSDDGLSISRDGVGQMMRYVLNRSGETPESFLATYPAVENIFADHSDGEGNLSLIGAYKFLHLVGRESGY